MDFRLNQWRHLRVVFVYCTFCIVCLLLISFYRDRNFMLVLDEEIENLLYNATIPDLAKQNNKDCQYKEILTNKNFIENTDIPKKIKFSSTGIVNGSYIPKQCNPTFSVAILVTYRDRLKQLNIFLPFMHNFLRKQNIHYRIYLIEQDDDKPWNKGLLYNVGAREAIADKFPCLILHDVDLLPLDEQNLYVCTKFPRHMSVCLDKYNYKLLYYSLVGGVLSIRTDLFVSVNGFSNRFLDWGAEDDDFATRLATRGIVVARFPRSKSRYTMLKHKPHPENSERFRILEENLHLSGDGMGSIPYTSMTIDYMQRYTWIRVRT